MAAPSIPNLLSLKKQAKPAADASRRAGPGRSTPLRDPLADSDADASNSSDTLSRKQKDAIVQATDTDANISRLSAVQAGYLQDPFAAHFTPSGDVPKRYPIINRGTYSRTTAIDRAVADFVNSSRPGQRQILSLGAGSDTRYFRLMHEGIRNAAKSNTPPPAASSGTNTPTLPDPPLNILYHEFDFAVNTKRKIKTIMATPRLRTLVGDPFIVHSPEAELHGPYYHLHACDLRDLDVSRPWTNADKPIHFNHLDPTLPTLLISECCLTYLAPGEADAVVRYFATKALSPTAPLGLVLYEPINPFDGFGKVMVSNLAKRGIVLQTMRTYHSLAAQRERLKAYGLTGGQGAVDMDFLFEHWVSEEERKRVVRVEMLDEVEELNLLAKHYCIAWGWREGESEEGSVWEKWAKFEEAEQDQA